MDILAIVDSENWSYSSFSSGINVSLSKFVYIYVGLVSSQLVKRREWKGDTAVYLQMDKAGEKNKQTKTVYCVCMRLELCRSIRVYLPPLLLFVLQ